jgi:hypothetical protein
MLIICILGATMIGWGVTKNNAIKHEIIVKQQQQTKDLCHFFANNDTSPKTGGKYILFHQSFAYWFEYTNMSLDMLKN